MNPKIVEGEKIPEAKQPSASGGSKPSGGDTL